MDLKTKKDGEEVLKVQMDSAYRSLHEYFQVFVFLLKKLKITGHTWWTQCMKDSLHFNSRPTVKIWTDYIMTDKDQQINILYLFTYSFKLCSMVDSQFPDLGWNLCPMKWEHGVLTTGLPESFCIYIFYLPYLPINILS